MAGSIRMTPETMRTRAREAARQAEAVQNVRDIMDRLLNTLKSEWEGEAVRGFEDRYNAIEPSFKNAKELLDEISYNLNKTASIVEETDRNIAAQYRK